MPNILANLVFFSWPLVVFWLASKYSTKQAIFLAFTLAILYLPNGFSIDLPLVPPIDRETMTSLSLLIILFSTGKKFRVFTPGLATKLIIGYFVVIILSCELNADPTLIGGRFLPGLTHYDAFSSVARMYLWMMPFFLGRYFINSVKDNEAIFKMLVMMGLIYTPFMLIELRMSPQFHNWVYGYSNVDFMQQMRGEGYRPTVFYGHGLGLAFWVSTCVIAALALQKNRVKLTLLSTSNVVIYLLIILVLCKTWSAMIYVLFAMFLIYRLKPVKQIKWCLLLAALVFLYPVTKTMGVFPDREIVSTIKSYSEERAQSLDFRFENEDILLKHALERPFFGWNGWGRNRVYDAGGKDISVTDGKWVVEFGVNGAMGFIFYYALMLLPLYYALKTVDYIEDPKDKIYFTTLAIVLAICIIDSIPNTGMSIMHSLFAGALLGQAESLRKQKNISKSVNEKPKFR